MHDLVKYTGFPQKENMNFDIMVLKLRHNVLFFFAHHNGLVVARHHVDKLQRFVNSYADSHSFGLLPHHLFEMFY